ncbi:MAG: hypothetical protein U5L00_12500 [Desulfovermiculus sp.]|nr:hypothetical protein [Desulfovermiculus sp.]
MQRIEQEEKRLDSRLSGHDEKEPSPGPSLPSEDSRQGGESEEEMLQCR